MKQRRLLFGALVATLIGATTGVYLQFGARREAASVSLPASASARLFASSLPDRTGKPQAIAQWRGQLLVVNFWASWCAPCREEIPALSRLQGKYANNGVQVIGIAVDSARNVADFAQKTEVAYPLLIAGAAGSELARALGNSTLALPYTLIVDRSGAIRNAHLGRLSEARLDALLLAQMAKE